MAISESAKKLISANPPSNTGSGLTDKQKNLIQANAPSNYVANQNAPRNYNPNAAIKTAPKSASNTGALAGDNDIGFFQRAADTLSGAFKSSTANYANAGATAYQGGQAGRTARNQELLEEYQYSLSREQKKLDDLIAANKRDPKAFPASDIESQQYIVDDWQRKVDALGGVVTNKVQEKATQEAYKAVDTLQESAQKDIATAKQGLGKVGQFAVDAGVAGAQMAGDVLAGALIGLPMAAGKGKAALVKNAINLGTNPAMATRIFGAGSAQARQAGATYGQQVSYGALTAAAGILTNKLANTSGVFKTAFGKGLLDDALTKIAAKPLGKLAVSALSEGGEEMLENALDPLLQKITYNPDAAYDAEWLAETLYSGAIGAVMGLGGALVSPDTYTKPTEQPTANPLAPAQGNTPEATTDAPEINAPQIAENEPQTMPTQESQNPAAEEEMYTPTESEAAFDRLVDEKVVEGTVGAAKAGFNTPNARSVERTGRLAETLKYNKYREQATGLTKDQYNEIFKYMSQSEEASLAEARTLLYYELDGEVKFLKDIDETAYRELVDSLAYSTAWNAPQTDAAYMIQEELMRRSIDMEITETEYTDFLEMMDEHLRESGRGVQANAKWSRNDNRSGGSTELEAWKELQKSNLTDAEKQERFRSIVEFDQRINSVEAGDTASMKEIVMEIAQKRGVLSNVLTGKQANLATKIASNALDKLSFAELKQFAFSSSSAYAKDGISVDAGRKFKAIQVLNMLSNLKTPATNLTGNTSFYLLDTLAMNGAALLDMGVSQITGTRSVAAEGSPFSKQTIEAAARAMNMSLAEIALDVDMGSETTRYGTGSSRTFKSGGVGVFNTNKSWDKFVERVISSFERNQAYLMVAPDEFFKGAARSTEESTRELITEGKIKTDDKEYAKKQAGQLAKYRTFQDDSTLATMIRGLHDTLNLIGFGDSGQRMNGRVVHAFGVGDIVAPFVRVAGNLAERGVDYSPIGAVRGVAEIGKQIYNAARGNDVNVSKQAKGVSDFARGVTGSVLAAGFMLLAKAGIMRKEDDEENADVAALNQSEGMSGTQISLDAIERWISGGSAEWQYGDKVVDLSRIQPINLIMNLGALLAEDEFSIATVYDSTVGAFTDSAAELPVLQFVGNTGERILKYGEKPTEVLAEEAANTLLSSLIPNAVRAIAKGLDDRPRNTYTGDTLAENIRDNFFNAIPGLRNTLPGSVNTMGEEKVYQDGKVENFINSILNPINVNTYTQSDVSKEMETVREKTGKTSFYPSKSIPSSVQYTDKKTDKTYKVDMTYEQRQQYQRDRGTTQMIVTADVMGSTTYKNASWEEKSILLNDCASYAAEIAKANVLGDKAAPDWVINARNSGNPQAYIQYKHIADGETSQIATAQALQKVSGISDAQRGKMWSQERNKDNNESTEAKNPFTGALPQAGISTNVSVDILDEYSRIGKKDIDKRSMTKEFKSYVYSLGLSGKQIRAVQETYKYWGSYPIEW